MLERIAAPERGLADEQHAMRIMVAAGDLAERGQHGDVGRPLAQIGHEGYHQIALSDGVEQLRRAHDLELADGRPPFRRELGRGAQNDVLIAEPRARQLTVIGGPVTSGDLVVTARLVLLAQRLGGTSCQYPARALVVGLLLP